ncbi:MAG: dephospho-CoA kinase [Flavobacteriaceae bacterium]
MKIVGLTGGIGSGKSTVAGFFETLGVPVYIADIEGKRITNTSKVIRRKIIALLGEKSFTENGINSAYVADKIFNNAALLSEVNKIIHPKVRQHFTRWVKKQKGPYCIKEAAILFENEGYKECDLMILVTAPEDIRIERILKRDKTTQKNIKARMSHQWPDEKKIPLSNFIISNIHVEDTKRQVLQIHHQIIKG